ncbi:MAG: hypothetical protein GY854_07370 [Deltaproteobacteria bacterium]|nr:hypothetical protein [Deltaproteobacteria bacterium]
MCCESEKGSRRDECSPKSRQDSCGCGCRCCRDDSSHGFRRKFISRAERVVCLEQYLAQLEAEVIGVTEQIADLKA